MAARCVGKRMVADLPGKLTSERLELADGRSRAAPRSTSIGRGGRPSTDACTAIAPPGPSVNGIVSIARATAGPKTIVAAKAIAVSRCATAIRALFSTARARPPYQWRRRSLRRRLDRMQILREESFRRAVLIDEVCP